jgi:hypothetical protein
VQNVGDPGQSVAAIARAFSTRQASPPMIMMPPANDASSPESQLADLDGRLSALEAMHSGGHNPAQHYIHPGNPADTEG